MQPPSDPRHTEAALVAVIQRRLADPAQIFAAMPVVQLTNPESPDHQE